MKKKMFYGAHRFIFERAKELRNQVTQSEMLFWGKLKECFPNYHFRRQHPLLNYVADFYSHKLKLIIELDGSIHNNEAVKINDEDKQGAIESLGIQVVRFTNHDVKHRIDDCIKIITDYINVRALE